jgi:hypothetical protein
MLDRVSTGSTVAREPASSFDTDLEEVDQV